MSHRLATMLSLSIIVILMLVGCGSAEAPAAEEPAAQEETASEESSESTAEEATGEMANEAPMLAEKVAAGELPPWMNAFRPNPW